jgi:uncharacterized SAM-binding protein YcdF (DUF218 family)
VEVSLGRLEEDQDLMLWGIPARLADPLFVALVALFGGLVALTRRRRPFTRGAPRLERGEKLALGVAWAGLLLAWLVSSPWTSLTVLVWLEPHPTDLPRALAGTVEADRVMVVLGAGLQTTEPSMSPRERLGASARGRLLGATRVYAEHPCREVIVTDTGAEATGAMADLLVWGGVPASRVREEREAVDTRTNAENVAKMLPERPRALLLVTSAFHMRRSLRELRKAGLDPIAVPVDYHAREPRTWLGILPTGRSLARASLVLHELTGLLRP